MASFGEIFSDYFQRVWDYSIDSLQHPAWNNGYYALIGVYTFTFLAELILPKLQGYGTITRKGFFTDLFYLFFIDFLIEVLGFLALTYTIEQVFKEAAGRKGVTFPFFDIGSLPFLVKFLIFFVVMDFFQFLAHFLLHRIEFMWTFHKIHHAQEELGFASTRHFHFGEYLILKPVGWLPLAFLGMDTNSFGLCMALYMWIAYSLVFFSHCNVKVNFGFLKYVVITPETHYWHHAKNIPGRYGTNFASVLTIWDLLFGSFYLPKDKSMKPILGVPDQEEVPNTFLGQMAYPFKILFRKKAPQSAGVDYRPAESRQERRRKEREKKK